jgi:hypothetical protein
MFGKSSIYRFKNVLYLYDFQQSGRTWYIMQELFYKLILISTLLALLVSTKAGYGQSENIEQDRGENSLYMSCNELSELVCVINTCEYSYSMFDTWQIKHETMIPGTY